MSRPKVANWEQIPALKKAGWSNIRIARHLGLSPQAFQHYIANLGLTERVYQTPSPVGPDGRRKCVECGKSKTPGAYKSDRDSTCTMCFIRRKKA